MIAALSVFLTIAGIEASVRWLTPFPYTSHNEKFIRHDTLLGWEHIPGVTGTYRTSEYTVQERFNWRGIRGPELSHSGEQDRLRILVLGDSFAEGYTVGFSNLFSEVLEDSLSRDIGSDSVQVLNAGVGGYSTDQEYLYFIHRGIQLEPDVVILLFYVNDIWYNGRNQYWRGMKPVFRLSADSSLDLRNVPVPEPGSAAYGNDVIESIKQWLGQHSYLYHLVARAVHAHTLALRMATKIGLTSGSPTTFPRDWTPFLVEWPSELQTATIVTERLLGRLSRAVRDTSAAFIVFYVPWSAEIYPQERKSVRDRWNRPLNVDSVRAWLSTVSRRNSFTFLDPTPLMRKSRQRLYYPHDGHWNAAGHRFVGSLLARFLVDSVLTPARVRHTHDSGRPDSQP